ncbi:Ig-like domain-containing protein [Nostoc sp. FACHB-133]|uniref:Ig-like domain-containing protein n=1 Tax=Nostoc sp. FACHB-133 TaxID=2692835 RepID=UPI00168394CA|nr:Ig-like domain-containing protein [Nostoc sp. FACHB-133]MBD2523046.1 TonB-dependent receptor [Nostoc sp. FACHB-133]
MKPRLHHTTIFNLKMMGVMPVALSLVLYPAIVKAEPTNENLFFPDSPSQADKGVENADFSRDLENLSFKTGEALNSPPSLQATLYTQVIELPHPNPPLGKGRELDFLSPLSKGGLRGVKPGSQSNSDLRVHGRYLQEKGARGLVFPNNVKNQDEDQADWNKVAEKSMDSSSPHTLGSSDRQLLPFELPSTNTLISDLQPSETEIQTFQPATSVDLPRDLGKLAVIKNEGRKDTKIELQGSPREIQGFQPAFSAQLPRGLRKIAGVIEENQKIPPTSPISTGIKFLMPTANNIVDVPATTVIVQFPVGITVELRSNGVLVDPSSIGRTESDANTNLVTQTWYGVSLKEGNNTISAQVVGGTEPPVTVQVVVRGAPQQITLETVESRIPADGRSTATIKGQLIDASGNRSNRDAVITLIPTAGEFVGKDFKPDQPGFQVEAKAGQFTAKLRSQLKAQTVTIRAIANNLEAFTQLQFETSLRPSLVTGVIDLRLGARGTDYYGSFRDFLPPDKDNRTQLDFHSAIFATGAIGEWLFTGAYNSSRNLNEDCNCDNRLFRTYQSSEQNYPVYGDSSRVDVVAPSIDSLYVRLERTTGVPGADPDYVMWGDYNTEEFARRSQQFTSITRQLHGFKANYNLGNLQVTGLYGNHLEAFQRDTIAPDGTSGYYFLSRRILQPGSENVFIELEELNRPGTVLERKQLNRGPDYEIDYDRGTLLFREPMLRTDIDQTGQVLVRRIVVSYQYDSEDSDSNIYAGRLQYNLSRKLNQESWIGATYVQENQGVRDFQLYGADALISLGNQGRLIAEYAHSTNDSDVVGKVSGEAYRLEAEGQITNGIQGRAYYRFADTGFANNATISFVPGQTRYGAQVTAKLTSTTNVRAQYDHEDNFGIAPQPLDTFEELFAPRYESIPGSKVDNSLTTISAGIQQRLGSAIIDLDWIHRHREDRIPDSALSGTSDQLRSRFTVPIAKNLTFQAQNEISLSSQKDSVYPDRTIFGLNWAAIPGVNISLAQQFYTSGQYSGNSITSLSVNGEHKLGSDTTLTGRYSILGGANEMTTQGAIGLNNRWTIASGLRLNVAYEHVFGNFFGRTAAGQQYAQPFAFGQSASAIGFDGGDSYSVGLEYSDNPQFQASARYEHRSSSGGSNTVITAGAAGKISPALTALVRYQQAGSSNQKLSGLGDTATLKLGLAYRDPNSDKFNALLRYEYRKNPSTIPDTILLGSGTGSEDHTFALEAIYAPNWQWEFYGKYALRNSTSYIASDLAGTNTVNLGQLRATYRLGYSWDLVGEARVISQSSYSETGFVVETGYYLTPNLRVSAGYVFGKVDDRDFSGTRSAGGAYLGVSVKLNELFDGFGQQKPVPRQPQESAMNTLVGKLKAATKGMQKREI